MEGHRVKTIVILILLVINGFLLALAGARHGQARRYEQSALEGSIRILAENGIELTEEAIARREGYPGGTAQRDPARESRLASALLGDEAESSSLGGGLYLYSSSGGQISFRAGGEFSAQLEKDPTRQTDDPQSHSAALMERLGIDSRVVSCTLWDGGGEVVCQQLLDGAPLFSGRITLTYRDGYLTDVSGHLLCADTLFTESDSLLSLPTVLMRFLDGILSGGDVCSVVTQVEPGYLLTQSFTGTIGLQPVWYLSTNTADYYVDGITGELTRVSD